MRIIQCSDSFLPLVDGVGSVVLRYATNMAERGHEVYVVAPGYDTSSMDIPFELVGYAGVSFARDKGGYKVGVPRLDPSFQKKLNSIEADVVHIHSPFFAGHAGLLYAKKHQVPVIGTFHTNFYDDILQITNMRPVASSGSKYVGRVYNKCDEVWAVSSQSAEAIRSYGCKRPVRIFGHGTDFHPTDPSVVEMVRKKYGLDGREMFLYVGQMNWKKNIRCILDAVAMLDFDYQLVLAGDGPHEKAIRNYAAKKGILDKLVFTGFISEDPEKMALFRCADLFVFPSIYDTFGLVVGEAAVMETPSVTVRGTGASECIRDGVNGFLCEDSPEDLAKVIRNAVSDRDQLKRVGIEAKKTIPSPWEAITDSAVEQYEALIRSFRSGQNS